MENINIEEITKEVVQVQEETKKEEIPVEEPPSPPSVEKVEGVRNRFCEHRYTGYYKGGSGWYSKG